MRALSVLLALLLVSVVMVSAMIPMTSGEEQTNTVLPLQDQDTGKSIYTMLGVEQPSREEGYQWQTYSEAKDQVDTLISNSESKENIKTVIGYLEGNREKIVLYCGIDENIYGILDNKGKISRSKVNPSTIGSKTEHFETSCKACLVDDQSANYSVNYELNRIYLSTLGSEEFSSRSIEQVQVKRTDSWVYLGVNSANLYTQGTFTYDDGNTILSISDTSYTSQGFGFDRCEFDHSTRQTSYEGFVEANAIWACFTLSPPKHSVDAQISCTNTGDVSGSSQTSDWVAVGFGCGSL